MRLALPPPVWPESARKWLTTGNLAATERRMRGTTTVPKAASGEAPRVRAASIISGASADIVGKSVRTVKGITT